MLRYTILALLVSTLSGCRLFNPAGAMLSDAREERTSEPEKALGTYRKLVAEYPESEEARLASTEGPTVALVVAEGLLPTKPLESVEVSKVAYTGWAGPPDPQEEAKYLDTLSSTLIARTKEGAFFDVARVYKTIGDGQSQGQLPDSYLTASKAVLDAQGDKRLAAAYLWLGAEGKDDATRAEQATTLLKMEPAFQPIIQDWLTEHLFAATADSCLTPLANLGSITDLETLDTLGANCGTLMLYAPQAKEAAEVERLLAGPLEDRRAAIKASPAYRVEQALAACVQFQSWVSGVRLNPPRSQEGMERVQAEMERRQPAMARHLQFLVDQVQRTEDYNLARRVSAACGR
jgi:hypothetical protein